VRPRRPHRRLHLEPPRPPPESRGSCHGRPGQRPGRRLLPWLAGAIAPAARALLGSMAGRGSCIGLGASRAGSFRQPSAASPCPVDVPPVNRRRFGPRSPESKQQRPQVMLRASKLSSTTSKSSSAAPRIELRCLQIKLRRLQIKLYRRWIELRRQCPSLLLPSSWWLVVVRPILRLMLGPFAARSSMAGPP
jgi:hypothetical protein